MTTATATIDERIKQLMRSTMPSNLIYAEQAQGELTDLKIYFNILDDIFDSKCSDAEKLKKIEYLINSFEESFECWSDLAISVLGAIDRLQKD